MTPFYLCTGFHRSGTSLVALSMAKNGVDMGSTLLGATFSNRMGHGEDAALVKLHDEFLARQSTDWRYCQPDPLFNNEKTVAQLRSYVLERAVNNNRIQDSSTNITIGAKDPRAVLFLDAWQQACQGNIRYILVYRHWHFAVSSLLKRHSRTLLQYNQPMQHRKEDIDFWRYPDLAAQMWLIAAQRMLNCQQQYKEQTLLFEHNTFAKNNQKVMSEASEKDINPAALKCDIYDSSLMQSDIPTSMLAMISPALKAQCDDMWEQLNNATALHTLYTPKLRQPSRIVKALQSDLREVLQHTAPSQKSGQVQYTQTSVQSSYQVDISVLKLPAAHHNKAFYTKPLVEIISHLKTLKGVNAFNRVNWDALLDQDNLSANAWVELFYLATKAKQARFAELFLLRAMSLRELYWQHTHLGDIYFQRKQFTMAERCYKKAEQLEPNHAGITAKLADIAIVNNQLAQAQQLLQQACDINAQHDAVKAATIRFQRAQNKAKAKTDVAAHAQVQAKSLTQSNELSTVTDNQDKCLAQCIEVTFDDYSQISALLNSNPNMGNRLDSYMMKSQFWRRNNHAWLLGGIKLLDELNASNDADDASLLCLLDYLTNHLTRYWPEPVVYSALYSEHGRLAYFASVKSGLNLTLNGLAVEQSVGVHVHVEELTLLPEMLSFLAYLPCNSSLVFSCGERDFASLQAIFDNNAQVQVVLCEPAQNDIAAWLDVTTRYLAQCDVALKLRCSDITQSPKQSGWRLQQLWSVLGDQQNVATIMQLFKQHRVLALLMPKFHPEAIPVVDTNAQNGTFANYPNGGMFWYRPRLLNSLFESDFIARDSDLVTNTTFTGTPEQWQKILTSLQQQGFGYQLIERLPQP